MQDSLTAIQAVFFVALLTVASVWDIKKRIVPDPLCLLLVLTGCLPFTPAKLLGVLLGLPLLVGELVTQHYYTGGIGGGDIKLTAACGFVLGLPYGITGLFRGLAVFCIYCFVFTMLKQKTGNKVPYPMAPFLSVGFIAVQLINNFGSVPL